MKVLFTSPILEHPPAGGPQLRIENSIKALSGECDLHVISRAPASAAELPRMREFFRGYCREFRMVPRLEREPRGHPLVRRVRAALRHRLQLDVREDSATVLEYLDRHAIDVLWCGYGNLSDAFMRRVRAARPQLKMVCDTDSVWSRFILRELPYAKGQRRRQIERSGKRSERDERDWVALCDVTTAVSEVDADYYRGLTRHKERIHLLPNVIDVASYAARPARPPGFKSPSIYLAGTFGHAHSPMDTAAAWVLEKVFPLLLKTHPRLHFYIVGNHSDKGFGHLNGPNITATGRVDSVLPYLCHTDVALVPLHFESGTRFKILEAGACGVPLVSTTLGAEGIPVVDGQHILIADDPEHFAAAILRLLEDRSFASGIADACRRLVEERFSVQALAQDARSILIYLGEARTQ
jgi:glycosyltransferase involved in cell wall biosynthesis